MKNKMIYLFERWLMYIIPGCKWHRISMVRSVLLHIYFLKILFCDSKDGYDLFNHYIQCEGGQAVGCTIFFFPQVCTQISVENKLL